VLKSLGADIVVNTDAIVEGVHFLPDDPPDTIARKALRTNLSDLAAKGAEPAGFVLTLALRDQDEAWLAAFARGLGEDAQTYGCALLGGDTVSTPGPLMVSVTAFGRVPEGRIVRRQGAQVGDHVVVSGSVGDAALGLAVLQQRITATDADALISRYRVPQPRCTLAQAVRDHATASMDVSDGLAGDLAKLCQVSGVSAVIEAAKLPLSAPAQALLQAGTIGLELLVAGGDDYEILCTVPDAALVSFTAQAEQAKVAVTVIGQIVAGDAPPRFVDGDGRDIVLTRTSYSHF
jgi:thiamine-monophosphate kinase